MHLYIIELRGSASFNRWQLTFHQPSDRMAAEYAERILRNDPCVQLAEHAVLTNQTEDSVVRAWEIKRVDEARLTWLGSPQVIA
jgi:hypothetical protein